MIQQDIPKLYTALAEWLGCMSILYLCKDFLMPRRWWMLAAVSLPLLMGIQWICGMLHGVAWLLGMCAAVGVMFLVIFFSLSMEVRGAVYMTCHAFMAAEAFAAVGWQIDYFLDLWPHQQAGHPLSWLLCVGCYLLLFGLYVPLQKRTLPPFARSRIQPVTRTQMIATAAVTIAFFAMSNLSYTEVQLPFTGTSAHEIFNIRSMMDLMGLGVLFALQVQRMEQLAILENQAIGERMRSQYQLYLQARQNHDLIDRKYHDLKHQLSALRMATPAARQTQLDEFEAGLNAFEDEFDTGNQILDTILAEKNGQCREQGIELAVMADGRLLNRLATTDLCAVLGNALDNAIEYEANRQGYRRIRLEISQCGGLTCVEVENHCDQRLAMRGGLPVSTKGDSVMHGFGLKSIQSTVERYGGTMVIRQEDGMFSLRISLPG